MQRWKLALIFAALIIIGIAEILYGISTSVSPIHIEDSDHPPLEKRWQQQPVIDPLLSPKDSFGACLMMKEDNDLLYEWIAFHYISLPLRYLFVGSDFGNAQNPWSVLNRWKDTDLTYWVINATNFAHRHGSTPTWGLDENPDHHGFLHRQRGFITVCSEFMKAQNMTWVTYHDSDEFIVPNYISPDENVFSQKTKTSNSTDNVPFAMRDRLTGAKTLLEVIRNVNQIHVLKPCYSIPRVLFGSLENTTCPEADEVTELAKRDYAYHQMSTLRFKQRASKGDFKTGRFGKVIVDLSRLNNVSIPPKNVHRPFKPECDYPAPAIQTSLFYINHYVGSWTRYSSRLDGRRSCEEWMTRAFLDKGNSCEQRIHEWLPKFIQKMGTGKAKYLLGANLAERSTFTPNLGKQCPPVTPNVIKVVDYNGSRPP